MFDVNTESRSKQTIYKTIRNFDLYTDFVDCCRRNNYKIADK